jgi:uncharacterized protein (DUF2164 family)
MAITLSPETTERVLASIKRYAAENLDQELGDLQARLLLDYVLKEIGPSVYNAAILDAQRYVQERVGDLDGVCFEKELTYWSRASKPSSPARRDGRGGAQGHGN